MEAEDEVGGRVGRGRERERDVRNEVVARRVANIIYSCARKSRRFNKI